VIAWHGDEKLKAATLAKLKKARLEKRIVQGYGWSETERCGCAVGSTIGKYKHSLFPVELGIDERVAHVIDVIHERLPSESANGTADAESWPERLLGAIPVGSDTAKIWPQFSQWLLVDPQYGVLRHARTDEGRAAIQRVADLYRDGYTPEQMRAAARAAARAARAAAEAETWAARAARAAWAAEAAEAQAAAAWAAEARAAWGECALAAAEAQAAEVAARAARAFVARAARAAWGECALAAAEGVEWALASAEKLIEAARETKA
jgi:hypothetical protein